MLILIFCLFCMNACVSKKDLVYFQNIDSYSKLQGNHNNNIKIKPDDLITIRVNSQEQEAANPFNLTNFLGGAEGNFNSNIELVAYQVSKSGTIDMPVIGEIKVEDYTVLELAEYIENEIDKFLPDATVTVRLQNFQISVLGEVSSPGTFTITDDHITLPKALGLAQDITIYGNRKEILVVRKEAGSTIHKYIDITDANSINSEFYNLKQNDIVYVRPLPARRQSSGYLGNAGTYVSLASLIVSIIVLITN